MSPLTAPEPPFGLGLCGMCPRACERTLIGLTVAQPSGTLGSATVQCDNLGAAKGGIMTCAREGLPVGLGAPIPGQPGITGRP